MKLPSPQVPHELTDLLPSRKSPAQPSLQDAGIPGGLMAHVCTRIHITMTTYVAVTAIAACAPSSLGGDLPPTRHLQGIGFFIADDSAGGWRFARRAQAVSSNEPVGVLLEWAADRLPSEGTLIGWNVDHALTPLLLDAAAASPPAVAHHFVGRLHRLLCGAPVDMSLGYGGAGAPPLTTVAADMEIAVASRDEGTITARDQLRRDLADEALAIWRLFVRSAGTAGSDAEAATKAWIMQRQRMSVVNGTDGSS